MPADLVLLCAHAYASDGAVVLFKDSGLVFRLSDSELVELKQSIRNFNVVKKLTVKNRTYEVENDHACIEATDQCCHACAVTLAQHVTGADTLAPKDEEYETCVVTLAQGKNDCCAVTLAHHEEKGKNACAVTLAQDRRNTCGVTLAQERKNPRAVTLAQVEEDDDSAVTLALHDESSEGSQDTGKKVHGRNNNEVANSSTAAVYFNTKVHVNNGTDRVLTLLLMGLTFNDWHLHVKNGSLTGIPPDVNLTMLNSFQTKYGRTPDIIRMAIPVVRANRTGLLDEPREPQKVGDRVEMDNMEWDFNDVSAKGSDGGAGRVVKLATHGQATSNFVAVDCVGFVFNKLLKSTGNTQSSVEDTVVHWELHGHKISLIAADQGVISQSKFMVMTPKTQDWCHRRGIKVEIAEPYNHSRGTASVERAIRSIKELMRIAFHYYKMNPNAKSFGFPERDVFKLWGEICNWAVIIQNLKPSRMDKTKTNYEMFYGYKPNMQNIRLLPIFSVVLVLGESAAGSYSARIEHKIALYVGPCMKTPGAIRCAVMTNGKLQIIRTSRFTAATDGGGLNIYPHVNRGISRLLAEQRITSIAQPKGVLKRVRFDDRAVIEDDVERQAEVTMPQAKDDADLDVVGRILAPRGGEPLRRSARLWKTLKEQVERVQAAEEHTADDVALQRSLQVCELLDQQLQRANAAAEEEEDQVKLGDVGEDEPEDANFADWSTQNDGDYYFNYSEGKFIQVTSEATLAFSAEMLSGDIEEGYAAVTKNVPKTFVAALGDHIWGEPARIEWKTLLETNAIVRVSKEFAESQLREGADLVYLFPVYEIKMRDGVEVRKVRLVGDGRTHYGAVNTYAATPSREELLIIFHLIASYDWEYVHIDEKRAFLSAQYQGEKPAFTRLRGNKEYYQILGALYGLKTSPKDYQNKVAQRFRDLGFTRLAMCGCIYVKRVEDSLLIVYAFVDDFIFTGSTSRSLIEGELVIFRQHAQTTEPCWNAPVLLGIAVTRQREAHRQVQDD